MPKRAPELGDIGPLMDWCHRTGHTYQVGCEVQKEKISDGEFMHPKHLCYARVDTPDGTTIVTERLGTPYAALERAVSLLQGNVRKR